MIIGAKDILFSAEGADQHEQSGLRKVEVGEKGVHNLEMISGIDEKIGMAGSGAHSASALPGGVFESADGGGPDRDDAAGIPAGSFNLFGGGFGDGVGLGVKLVLFYRFGADGLEGSETDMESDFGGFDSTFAKAGENLRSEM